MPIETGNRDDEQMSVRHADASGGDITENQHEENRMRDIHIGKRGPEAAGEEQPDKLRKTVRFEQEASSASASSNPTVTLEFPASGETRSWPGSVLVQSGHVDDDVQISWHESNKGSQRRQGKFADASRGIEGSKQGGPEDQL